MSLLFPIVEGHGEVGAIPALIRRIAHDRLHRYDCEIAKPYRIPRSKIAQFGDTLEKALRLGEGKITASGGNGGIIILVDADDDCPVQLNQRFTEFMDDLGLVPPVAFIAANKEYEAWFIACGEQLRFHKMIRDNALSHPDPETVRDAKGHFNRHILLEEYDYSETIEQEKFSTQIDLETVHNACRSFRKLHMEVERLTDPT